MPYSTTGLCWRTSLNQASSSERWVILNAIEYAERTQLLCEVESVLCRSALGIVDCSNLQVRAVSYKWARRQRRIFLRVKLRVHPGGAVRNLGLRSLPR
jgi:hypothetical protein